MSHKEIEGDLAIDPAILEKLGADPRYVELVKKFVVDSAALTVRIANELDPDMDEEDQLCWSTETLSAESFLFLSVVLGRVLNDSFTYAEYSAESWGWTTTEIVGGMAFADPDDHGVSNWADAFGDFLVELEIPTLD